MFLITTGGFGTRHTAPFLMSRPAGLPEYVILLMKSKAVFTACGQTFPVTPVSALLITPDTPYQYSATEGDYMDDWLHFTCTDADMDEYRAIPPNRPVRLFNPSGFSLYIRQLLWENNYAPKTCRRQNADMLLRIFLNNLSHLCSREDLPFSYSPWHAKLQNLRLSMQAQPYLNYRPGELAASMGISLSYFQHLYTDLFGISFQADLISLRLDYARDLIHNTTRSMAQIADLCGYMNEVHFYRQFKKQFGMTPAQYRKTTI